LLLASSENIVNPIWSPDGQWIALTYLQASGGSNSSLGLLQPDTCRFIQLGEQKGGWLWSWMP
jgi:Tol biopolymer transport system component